MGVGKCMVAEKLRMEITGRNKGPLINTHTGPYTLPPSPWGCPPRCPPRVSSRVTSRGVLQGVLQGFLQGCPPRVSSEVSSGVSSKVSSREDTLPILFIYRKLYSLTFIQNQIFVKNRPTLVYIYFHANKKPYFKSSYSARTFTTIKKQDLHLHKESRLY
jgi:hypothetical protein